MTSRAKDDATDSEPLSLVSLFSGAGGLDVGLHRTGRYELRACVEVQPVFTNTLRCNRDAGLLGSSDTAVIEADLASLTPRQLMSQLGIEPGELDVLAGGPPCQSFSTAGRRQSVQDPRGTLLWDFGRFVAEMRPRFFVMENVRGLLSASLRHRPIAARPNRGGAPLQEDEIPGSVVKLWVEDLVEATGGAYRVDCFEVNAVNYGAPQLRERVLFIGNRDGLVLDFPDPTHGPVDLSTYEPVNGLRPFTTLGQALAGFEEDEPIVLDFSPRKKHYLSMVPPGGNWRTLPEPVARESMGRAYDAKGGRSGWWRRLSWDLPCPTVVTMPNHASTSMCHPDEVRALSVGECARIQEFPDGWTFVGSVQEQMTQVGNAVPARLGELAGETIASAFHLAQAASDGSVEPFRRVYLRSHVRTRQWFKAGEAFLWDGIGGTAHYNPRRRPEAA